MPRFAGAPTSAPHVQSASRISVSTPVASSPNDDPRLTEIRQIASQINQRTLFEALGVSPEATADEVKEAYFALAKVWHPDRIPAELSSARTEVNTVFARMSLAYQTLIDANRRKTYVSELAAQENPEEQAMVARVLDAASEFQKAEVMLKKGDLVAAEELALRAVKADPANPDYDTLLAWVRATKAGTSQQDVTLCVGVLSDVLRQHPDHQRALWYRGNLLKRIGNDELAVDDFRKLLKLKPNSVDAEREIRLYEMRNRGKVSSSQPPAASAGASGTIDSLKDRFGKLFKR
jgi:tetratricopeptide (TPR) repeat protein